MKSKHETSLEFSIPIIPGLITVKHTIKVKQDRRIAPVFRSRFYSKLELMIPYTLAAIAEDQFIDGYVAGGWGKGYSRYLRHLFGTQKIPEGVSVHDTISFGTWNIDALLDYVNLSRDPQIEAGINVRIEMFYHYLLRHINPDDGGFGVGRIISSGEIRIVSDIRHTVWAVLALLRLDKGDNVNSESIFSGSQFLALKLRDMNFREQWGITNAAIHRVLSSESSGRLIVQSDRIRSQWLAAIEAALVEGFDWNRKCWMRDNAVTSKTELENNLIVLYTLGSASISSNKLKNIIYEILRTLQETHLIDGDDGLGLPFCIGEKPDFGTTIHFLYILIKHIGLFKPNEKKLSCMAAFGYRTLDNSESKYRWHSYSWQFASLLKLLAFSNKNKK